MLDSSFWIIGFGFLIVGFLVLDSCLWSHGFGFLVVDSSFWILGLGLPILHSWFWIPGVDFDKLIGFLDV